MVYFEANPSFSWSIGGRGILWECGCLSFGLESQYFATYPRANFIRSEGSLPVYFSKKGLEYWEFQIGFGVAYIYTIQCIKLSPYAGFEWSRAHFDSEGANRDLIIGGGNTYLLRNFENARDLGFCLGLSLVLYESWIGSVEGHFGDQTALSVDVRLRF
jgi:hypothetical protein